VDQRGGAHASVFLLLDADTEIPEEIERQKRQIFEVFRRYGLTERVQIHMAVPMLEAWLLAAYRVHPEQSTHPKRDFARYAGQDAANRIGELAAALPIDLARHRSKSWTISSRAWRHLHLQGRGMRPDRGATRGPRGRTAG
jgi:hypothetical protein